MTPWLVIIGIVMAVTAISYSVYRLRVSYAVEEGRPKVEAREAQRNEEARAQARTDTLETLLAELRSRIDAAPQDSMLVISAANIAYDLGRFDEAERYYTLFLENIDPGNVSARIDLSYVIFRNGRQEEALGMLHDIIRRDPRQQTAMFNLAYLYDQSGEPDKAVQWMENVVKADPESALGKRARQVLDSR
jgi:tetratricopeptide (TPR) repeat protein